MHTELNEVIIILLIADEMIKITSKDLESLEEKSLRVLVLVGGLFRAGELFAITAPDLYGIKLDGERGQRTHIYSKEEVLEYFVSINR